MPRLARTSLTFTALAIFSFVPAFGSRAWAISTSECDIRPLKVTQLLGRATEVSETELDDWLRTPHPVRRIEQVRRDLESLTNEERKSLAASYQNSQPPYSPGESVLRYLLYDVDIWKAKIAQVKEKGDFNSEIPYRLLGLIDRMPRNVADALLKDATKGYDSTSKVGGKQSQRRALELLITRLYPAKKAIIEPAQSRRVTPLAAYQAFLDRQTEIYQGTGRGGAKADDVMAVARNLQNWLRGARLGRQYEKKIVIYGSFPSGRSSKLNSDIDMLFVLKPGEEKSILVDVEVEKFQNELHPILNQPFAGRGMAFDSAAHAGPDVEKFNLGYLTPIQITVTENEISLETLGSFSMVGTQILGPRPNVYKLKLE